MIEIRLEVVGVFRAAVSSPRASARLPAECGLFLWCRMLRPLIRPIVRPLVRRVTAPSFGWSPRALFAAGEVGAWYDPSDTATLFQDSAGTTPVTALGQPVGLMLDKSQGLVLGSELTANGGFDTDSDWTKGVGWAIGSGVASRPNTGAVSVLEQSGIVTIGKWYRVTLDLVVTSGGINLWLGGVKFADNRTASGPVSAIVLATLNTKIECQALTTFAGSIDNISVRELPGNHASQLTDTARPTVQARVNLLTATEDFTSAPWVKETGVTALSANTVSFPAGSDVANRLRQAVTVPQRSIGSWSLTLDVPPVSAWSDPTATLYLTTATGGLGRATTVNATNEWQRVTMVEPPPPTGTFINYMVYADKPVTITGLSKTQLELGSTPTTYQRVTSATDYADVGAKRKIDFDAVDDYLRTVFPDLGADVTIARSIPGTGAQILTGQTIGAGNWDDSTDSHALIVIERALTAPETAMLTRYLNLRAGVTL